MKVLLSILLKTIIRQKYHSEYNKNICFLKNEWKLKRLYMYEKYLSNYKTVVPFWMSTLKNEWDQIMELLNQLWGKDYTIYGFKIDFGDNCTQNVPQYICPRFKNFMIK